MEKIPLENIQSINYDRNIDKYGECENTCICCGKRIKGKVAHVHLYTDGNVVSNDAPEDENSQGCFPIGPQCKKKIPKSFII